MYMRVRGPCYSRAHAMSHTECGEIEIIDITSGQCTCETEGVAVKSIGGREANM